MKLHSREYGKGFPIIILHGLYGSSDNWVSIGKRLSENYSVYLIDQRNHGNSEHSNLHNYDVMSDDLNEFFIENKLKKAILIGHSMGGKTAMFFANKYSEKLESIIVVDISPFSYSVENAKVHEYILESLSKIKLEVCKTRNEIEKQLIEFIKEYKLRKFLLKNIARRRDNSFYWKINLKVLKESLPNILEGVKTEKQINIPTLFIKGEKSNHLEIDEFDKIRAIFTKSEFVEIKNAGHWLHAEQPEEFLKTISKYIQNI